MHEIDRLSGSTDWIDLDFVQRERTPERIVEVGLQLHLACLSLSNIKQYLDRFVPNGHPQLGTKSRVTADRQRDAGSHRDRRDGDLGE